MQQEKIENKANQKEQIEKGIVVKDEKGRSIKIKKPGFLARLKLTEALGNVAENNRYFQMVEPLLWIVQIDDLPFSIGTSKREVEAAYAHLGQEGLDAFTKFIYENILNDGENVPTDESIAIEKHGEIESLKK